MPAAVSWALPWPPGRKDGGQCAWGASRTLKHCANAPGPAQVEQRGPDLPSHLNNTNQADHTVSSPGHPGTNRVVPTVTSQPRKALTADLCSRECGSRVCFAN